MHIKISITAILSTYIIYEIYSHLAMQIRESRIYVFIIEVWIKKHIMAKPVKAGCIKLHEGNWNLFYDLMKTELFD